MHGEGAAGLPAEGVGGRHCSGNLNPFQQDGIVLCSYQFARAKEPSLRQTPWDLVVIDEAHRLRNVYRGSSKIAVAIKQAVAPFPKVRLESGVDFEKRIAAIYQQCRTPEQVRFEFDQLQRELEPKLEQELLFTLRWRVS